MTKHIFFLLIIFTPILGHTQTPVVIKNVSVINVKTGEIRGKRTVLIQGKKITSVSTKATIPKSATVIDGTGKYLIPGLWDMHIHTLSNERIESFFPLLVANGITGVRDMGTSVGFEQINVWRKQIREDKISGPRIVASGPIVDGPNPASHLAVVNASGAKRIVDSLKEHNVDFIKVYNNLNQESFFAIAEECKKLHIPFAGHLPLSVNAIQASNAGQKSLEHMGSISGGILLSCSNKEGEIRKSLLNVITKPQFSIVESINAFNSSIPEILRTFDPEKEKLLTKTLVRNSTWLCPTLVLLRIFTFPKDSVLKQLQLDYLIPSVRQGQDPKNSPVFRNQTPEMIDNYRQLFHKNLELVNKMHRAGVKFLAGTDSPIFLSVPGFSLQDELQLLVEAGLSPIEALRTATINPAECLGKERDFGTVEKGKVADLLLLDANPLQDISNTKKIAAVIVNGRLLQRSDLDALLQHAKEIATK